MYCYFFPLSKSVTLNDRNSSPGTATEFTPRLHIRLAVGSAQRANRWVPAFPQRSGGDSDHIPSNAEVKNALSSFRHMPSGVVLTRNLISN
jgi:hypothetical protein